jgi:hypothetical protein
MLASLRTSRTAAALVSGSAAVATLAFATNGDGYTKKVDCAMTTVMVPVSEAQKVR